MFCENCGMKNENDAKFCEGCGAVLGIEEVNFNTENNYIDSDKKNTFVANDLYDNATDNEFKYSSYLNTDKKSMSLKNKILLAIIGVLVILCGSFYFVGKIITAPEKTVEKYFENISSHKYAEAYDYMDIDNNEFTTKDIFVKAMENQNRKKEDILNYTIKENPDSNPLMKEYTVTYTQKGNGNVLSMDVTLIKQSSKKWLIYDDYKIAENGLTAKNISVTIPHGAEIYIDGIKVNENYAETGNATNKNSPNEKKYVIPSIFIGTHKIKVSTPFSKDNIFDQYIENGEFINVQGVELTDNAKEEVSDIAEEFLSKVVTSAIGKKAIDEISTYFSNNANIENIQNSYNNLKDKGINDDGAGIKNVTFKKFESTPHKEYQSKSNYGVNVNYEYGYTALKENWFDDTVEEYTPESLKEGNATIYFTYEDGQWKVADFRINIYLYY